MVRVKICGITTVEDALLAVEAGADALGFNFWPQSPRYIEPARARAIVAQLPPLVTCVGVFVNVPDPETISRIMIEAHLDVVQLHGEETPDFCRRVAARWRVIKAVRVGPDFHPADLVRYPVSAILLDAAQPGAYGGTGTTFEWTIARRAAQQLPRLILAGGLTPENVVEAIRSVRPYAVDVCTGVEREPGRKDADKMRAFIARAKAEGARDLSSGEHA